MKRLFAVKAQSVDGTQDPVVGYAICDKDYKSIPDVVFMGYSGDINDTEARYPFMVFSDGRVDFGASYSGAADRFSSTNLRDKTLRPGEIFTARVSIPDNGIREQETLFKIKEVVLLTT